VAGILENKFLNQLTHDLKAPDGEALSMEAIKMLNVLGVIFIIFVVFMAIAGIGHISYMDRKNRTGKIPIGPFEPFPRTNANVKMPKVKPAKMSRIFELTPQQIKEWRKARMAEGQKRYGDRDLKRYNLVDVTEELLDCLNILERFDNRARHQNFTDDIILSNAINSTKDNLIEAISTAIKQCAFLDELLPDEMCTDENGDERIWWPK
jgi:hypothetical protein